MLALGSRERDLIVCVCVRACAGAYVWWDRWEMLAIEWRLVLCRKDPLGGGGIERSRTEAGIQ